MIVYALKDINTGLFWNQAHKDFRPLAQNTLFMKNMGQVNRMLENRTMGYVKQTAFENKEIIPVEIEIIEKRAKE